MRSIGNDAAENASPDAATPPIPLASDVGADSMVDGQPIDGQRSPASVDPREAYSARLAPRRQHSTRRPPFSSRTTPTNVAIAPQSGDGDRTQHWRRDGRT
jgi:hypothetical protein